MQSGRDQKKVKRVDDPNEYVGKYFYNLQTHYHFKVDSLDGEIASIECWCVIEKKLSFFLHKIEVVYNAIDSGKVIEITEKEYKQGIIRDALKLR